MGTSFSVPSLASCRVCDGVIDRVKNRRLRSYCSPACRNRFNAAKAVASGYSQKWQQEKADARARFSRDKKKCGVCGRWYRRVARHVFQRHGMTAREYKQHMELPLGRGILSQDAREHLRDTALAHGMDKQLIKAGKASRFVPGGKKQRGKKPNAGRRFPHNDYY